MQMLQTFCSRLSVVMAGLVPAIHDLLVAEDVDARHKAGHDDGEVCVTRPGSLLECHHVQQRLVAHEASEIGAGELGEPIAAGGPAGAGAMRRDDEVGGIP